jgi:hypothetical protein
MLRKGSSQINLQELHLCKDKNAHFKQPNYNLPATTTNSATSFPTILRKRLAQSGPVNKGEALAMEN